MNKNQKNSNGVDNVLSPDLQRVREQIVVDELKARHWRAQYETAYYHIQFDKILPEYTALLEKLQKEREEIEQKQKEFMEKLQTEMNEGELKGSGLIIQEEE